MLIPTYIAWLLTKNHNLTFVTEIISEFEDIQRELNITFERGKENLGQLANIEGIHIWCSITENKENNKWKVSIRSKEIKINGVAEKYHGGGHDQASGAEIYSLDELPSLIADLDALID